MDKTGKILSITGFEPVYKKPMMLLLLSLDAAQLKKFHGRI
ncbi:MAG: hypothetical protein U0T85_08735 [Cloacibacterium normanense]